MTFEIALVLIILVVALVLLITEKIPVEATALLVLSSLAITGVIAYTEALSGFSSPAVVTVWAVFILSGGLTRTGVANAIGRQVMRFSGRGEPRLIVLIMLSSGVMSAFMNNVAVAALLLPVIMDITRKTGRSPSRLLMPLAYGCLLGGLTTQIGTPPNILVSEALREHNLIPFSMFDFTPVGLIIMLSGIIYMAFPGRYLLPETKLSGAKTNDSGDLKALYDVSSHLINLKIPDDSSLVGKNLIQSGLGRLLGISVLGITRGGLSLLAPGPSTKLQSGDVLVCGGNRDQVREILAWSRLEPVRARDGITDLLSGKYEFAVLVMGRDSDFVDKNLEELNLYQEYGLIIMGILKDKKLEPIKFHDQIISAGQEFLVLGDEKSIEYADKDASITLHRTVNNILELGLDLGGNLLSMKIPRDSLLSGKTLEQSALGSKLGMRVLLIVRQDGSVAEPDPETKLRAGDLLVVTGSRERLQTIQALDQLEISPGQFPDTNGIEDDKVGLMEVMLSPHTTLTGKTLGQLNFREKHGLTVLAIWRKGKAVYSGIRDMTLRQGDAILVYGPREKIVMLGREPDFLVLTESAQESLRREKLPLAVILMTGVIFPVIMGWIHISIAAVCGAAFMVLTKCLTMQEAYRFIEWKAIFLIAGMMPLGIALDQTGAAALMAEKIVSLVGPYGPRSVMLGLLIMTFSAKFVIPSAALVVLMAPIVLNASADMGILPYPMMMAMALAASSSFMSPVAHPANLLVMGPGGYRFVDYLKLGIPLTLLVLMILMIILPLQWPLDAV